MTASLLKLKFIFIVVVVCVEGIIRRKVPMLASFVVPSDVAPFKVLTAIACPHAEEQATAAYSRNLFEGLCHYLLFLIPTIPANRVTFGHKRKKTAYLLRQTVSGGTLIFWKMPLVSL